MRWQEKMASWKLTPLILCGLLIAMCVVIGLVLISPEVESNHGVTHPEFDQSMLHGGSGAERHQYVRWLGLAFGLLQVAFFVGCLLLGMRERKGRVGVFVCFGVIYAIAFTLMVVFDHSYAAGETRQIVLGFPLPTAIMVYGVGGAPLAFVLIYMLRFDRWILTPQDMERFERLVQEKRGAEQTEQ
jgi:hypothetical protein